MTDALGHDRVLLGFPGAAAVPHEDAIRYVITSAREQPTTLGELDGSKSARIGAIASALEASGFPVSVSANIDAWLKTHVAKILPTVCTLFQAGGHPEQLAADAWGRFQAEGALEPGPGDALRKEILSVGASRPALESFIAFRGRPPEPGPLLKSYGLT